MPFLRSRVWGNDFPRSIIDPSSREFGWTVCHGRIIEDGLNQHKKGRILCGCHCGDWPFSFPLATRAHGSFANDGDDVERLLDAG